jgi:hypothetical protein
MVGLFSLDEAHGSVTGGSGGRRVLAELDELLLACDEDAYRILNTPGQAVSGVDDQARRVLGRAG